MGIRREIRGRPAARLGTGRIIAVRDLGQHWRGTDGDGDGAAGRASERARAPAPADSGRCQAAAVARSDCNVDKIGGGGGDGAGDGSAVSSHEKKHDTGQPATRQARTRRGNAFSLVYTSAATRYPARHSAARLRQHSSPSRNPLT